MRNIEDIAKSYDAMHEDWKDLEEAVRFKEFSNLVSFCNGEHKTVIEFGLGDGVFTHMLCEHFEHVTAVDAAQTTIELLEQSFEQNNITFEQNYIEDFNSEATYDVIVMSHLLEHLADPVMALKNIKRLMHKNSVLYISVPNASSIHRLVATKMGILKRPDSLNQRDIDLGHQIVFYPNNFKSTVEAAGLKISHFGGVMIKPLANSQISTDWSREMVEGFIALGDDLPELCGDIFVVAKR
jgi:2-polyprenyl-3-methyl-5-hydroxy-6-metoxy-1,4-benzoquinol methylase